MTATALAAVAALTAFTAPASADPVVVKSFKFIAEKGAFPVSDRSAYWATPDHEVRIRESAENVLKIDNDSIGNKEYIAVELAAPGGAPLQVGTYTDVRQRSTADNPGLLVIAGGFGCYPVHGNFTVQRIERDDAGRLTVLDVELEQRCGSPTEPAFYAHVHLGD